MNRQSNNITAIYTRIDHPGNSFCIEEQKDSLRRYAVKLGLPNIEFYSDNGYSGIDPNRPDFNRLLADVKQGKIANLVVHSLDRLYRDYISASQLVGEFLPAHNIDLYAVRDGIAPESPWVPFYKRLPGAMGGER